MNMNQRSAGIRCATHGLVAAVALWTAGSALAQNASATGSSSGTSANTTSSSNGQLDRKDANFIKDAAKDDQGEVDLGKLAVEKGQKEDIKQLRQNLEQDHTKVMQQLQQLAQSKGVALPTGQAHKEERAENRLQDKTGAAFDKSFAEFVLKDHERDIKNYEKHLQTTKDPDVKAFIEQTLPGLRQHLQMARTAGAAVGVDQRTLSSVDKFLSSQRNEGLGTAPGSQTGTTTVHPNTYNNGNTSGQNPVK